MPEAAAAAVSPKFQFQGFPKLTLGEQTLVPNLPTVLLRCCSANGLGLMQQSLQKMSIFRSKRSGWTWVEVCVIYIGELGALLLSRKQKKCKSMAAKEFERNEILCHTNGTIHSLAFPAAAAAVSVVQQQRRRRNRTIFSSADRWSEFEREKA